MIILCVQKVKALLLAVLLALLPAAQPAAIADEPAFSSAVFFSYIDLARMLSGDEASYTLEVVAALDNITASLGADAVFFHARSHGDSLYRSRVFPPSPRLALDGSGQPAFDPLEIFVREASARGVAVFAWVNPYRIGDNAQILSGRTSQDAHFVLKFNGSSYLNPASEDARALVVEGVAELLENYGVAGVIFDDYFYPATDEAFDASAYAEYTAAGGTLSLADWRRRGVTALIADTHALARRCGKLFGLSPAASPSRNREVLYADVASWIDAGLLDFVCPQLYFGFENTSMPFVQTLETWRALCAAGGTRLYPALAAYKIGERDGFAGGGALEWTRSSDILARQTRAALDAADGVAYYRYDSLFNPSAHSAQQVLAELENIQKNGEDNVSDREKEDAKQQRRAYGDSRAADSEKSEARAVYHIQDRRAGRAHTAYNCRF